MTVCALAEKCYLSGARSVVIVNDREQSITKLDALLWTYSRKFIPHATKFDKYTDVQPVYITDKLEVPNSGKSIILVNVHKELVLDLLLLDTDKLGLQNILYIFTEESAIQFDNMKDLIERSALKSKITLSLFTKHNSVWNRSV
ncbi:DNA polymerase III subunit chi [Rickettsia endosymbiont of Cardiosporidium cionae]|uniref:DNA polymerase III subunit chi n=1 Tax=Rickettsia endosymbiont of Cardiosporidium cionae TaxID=2777155 RepID=UPI001E55AC43|nr:DNA polymerase III subunit chi [Rickettsia endosymbiont of Cardiosporidium cionae]KAF8818241.1 hypothetical protein IHI24_000700 [Rickettsia endosymbiont of Cardiosporidium cionae]